MIVVGKLDSEGFLPSERLDVYDAKSDIDFDNRAKYVAINAGHSGRWGARLLLHLSLRGAWSLRKGDVCIGGDHSGRERGRLLLIGGLVGLWRSGKR